MRRISAVRAYLTGAGVPTEKLGAPIAQGEPLVATTAANHYQFRRVSIRLEGTPRPIPQPAGNGGGAAEIPLPQPFAAEQFLPQVEAGQTPMKPYEWCHLDEAQKTSLRDGLKRIIKEGLTSLLAVAIKDNLPDDYEIDVTIPVPFTDDIHIQETISIQERVMSKVTPIANGAINGVMSDAVFGNLMDGACSLPQ